MILKLSDVITRYLLHEQVIEENHFEVYRYGLEIIISTIIGAFLIMMIGFFTSTLNTALLFYLLFVFLRFYTGGYHAKTHFKCKLTLVSCYVFLLLTSYLLDNIYNPYINILIQVFYLIVILLFAPVEHLNAPMTESEAKKNRIIAIAMAVIMFFITMIMSYSLVSVAKDISLTQMVVALLIISSVIRKGGENNEGTESEHSEGSC